ncbi:MAG: DUF6036 family nucleotidyltransferase [Planctomycetota bacterium]
MTEPAHEFITALRDIMQVIETDYQGMIIGGVAVIALGYPRLTTDIDSTILVSLNALEPLLKKLDTHGIDSRIENTIDFAKSNHVLLMKHRTSGINIDISLAGLPFEKKAIADRQFINFAGVRIAIPKVEDILIYKMVASRTKDLRDVEELLLRHIDKINLAEVRNVLKQFATLLERPEIITQLEELIKRVK